MGAVQGDLGVGTVLFSQSILALYAVSTPLRMFLANLGEMVTRMVGHVTF